MHLYIPQRRCCWIVFTSPRLDVPGHCSKFHSSAWCVCLFGLTCEISLPPPPSAMQLKPTNLAAIFVSFHNTAWQTTSKTNRGMQYRYYSFWFAFQAFHSLFASSISDKGRQNYTRPLRGRTCSYFRSGPGGNYSFFQRRISIFRPFIFCTTVQAGLIRHIRRILCSKWAWGKTRVSVRKKEGAKLDRKVFVCLLRVSSRVESSSFWHWWPLCLVWAAAG